MKRGKQFMDITSSTQGPTSQELSYYKESAILRRLDRVKTEISDLKVKSAAYDSSDPGAATISGELATQRKEYFRLLAALNSIKAKNKKTAEKKALTDKLNATKEKRAKKSKTQAAQYKETKSNLKKTCFTYTKTIDGSYQSTDIYQGRPYVVDTVVY